MYCFAQGRQHCGRGDGAAVRHAKPGPGCSRKLLQPPDVRFWRRSGDPIDERSIATGFEGGIACRREHPGGGREQLPKSERCVPGLGFMLRSSEREQSCHLPLVLSPSPALFLQKFYAGLIDCPTPAEHSTSLGLADHTLKGLGFPNDGWRLSRRGVGCSAGRR